jgi:hypothetical protein
VAAMARGGRHQDHGIVSEAGQFHARCEPFSNQTIFV